jgi:hypothetical protein
MNGGPYVPVGISYPGSIASPIYSASRASRRVTGFGRGSAESRVAAIGTVTATTHEMNDDELPTMLEEAAAHYY